MERWQWIYISFIGVVTTTLIVHSPAQYKGEYEAVGQALKNNGNPYIGMRQVEIVSPELKDLTGSFFLGLFYK
jgi:hypothetical protein